MDGASDLDVSRLSLSSAKFRETALRRQDKEIEKLSKENFDLQLKLFHLEEKLGAMGNKVDLTETENRFVTMMEGKQRELEHRDRLLVKARQIIYSLQERGGPSSLRADGAVMARAASDEGQSSSLIERVASLEEEIGEARKLLTETDRRAENDADSQDAGDGRLNLENFSRQLQSAEEARAEAFEQVVSLKNDLGDAIQAMHSYQQRICELEGSGTKVEKLEENVDKLQRSLEVRQKREMELLTEVEQLQLQKENICNDYQLKLNQAEAQATDRLRELEEILGRYAGESSDWGSRLEAAFGVERERTYRVQEKVEQWMKKAGDLESETMMLHAKLDAAEGDAQTLRDRLQLLETQLGEKSIQHTELKTDATENQVQLENCLNELAEAHDLVDELRYDVEQVKAYKEDELQRLVAGREQLEAVNWELREQLQDLDDQLAAKEERYESMEEELRLLKAERDVTADARTEMSEELERTREERDAAINQNEQLRSNVEDAEKMRTKLDKTVTESLETADDLEREVKELWLEVNRQNEEVGAWKSQAEKLESQLKNWQEIAEAKQRELEEADGEKALLVQRLDAENRRDSDQNSRTSDGAATGALIIQNAELEQTVRAREEQLEDVQSQLDLVTQEHTAQKSRVSELEEQLETLRRVSSHRDVDEVRSSGASTDAEGPLRRVEVDRASIVTEENKRLKQVAQEEAAKSQDLRNELEVYKRREERENELKEALERTKMLANYTKVLGTLQDQENAPRGKTEVKGPWKQMVLRQLERSRLLTMEINQSVDVHRKLILDGLVY